MIQTFCQVEVCSEMNEPINSSSPAEIKNTDIVFDCPYCEKSLAIDYRGAGLVIACPDCSGKVQVPIPDGMEISDLDTSDEDQEIRIIQLRKLIADAQKRVIEVEAELARRDQLALAQGDRSMSVDVIAHEMETIQKSLKRIMEVAEGVPSDR